MHELDVPTFAEIVSRGERPDLLFWVGCAGSYDERAKKVTRSIVKILNKVNIKFGVLGTEERCTGDPARRAGNEFLFQLQALQNIRVFEQYAITRILTSCPHCFNTLKNEYPELGGNYEVLHHSTFIQQLIDSGKLVMENGGAFRGQKITYHDSCYLGRANNIYAAPRNILKELDADLVEMENNRSKGLCCGAGGGQMFKEPEEGSSHINIVRAEQAIRTGASTIAVACPFCLTMLTDGIKGKEMEGSIEVKDIAEIVSKALPD